jgi:hypothetical protein
VSRALGVGPWVFALYILRHADSQHAISLAYPVHIRSGIRMWTVAILVTVWWSDQLGLKLTCQQGINIPEVLRPYMQGREFLPYTAELKKDSTSNKK